MGQVTTLPAVRVPGGAPSIYGVLSLRATLRTSSEGPLRHSARDLGNFEEEQREHRLTCAGYARAYGEDDRDRAGERDGGPKKTEALVRQGSQGAREQVFQPGEEVLVLLPTMENKLTAQWQGPYKVLKQIGKVNYCVDMHDRRRVFHLNMLRKWHAPSAVGYWAQELERERGEADDVPFWNEGAEDGTSDAATLGEQLSVQQKQDLQDLMDANAGVFRNRPGRAPPWRSIISTVEPRVRCDCPHTACPTHTGTV